MISASLSVPPCTSECSPSLHVEATCAYFENEIKLSGDFSPVGKFNHRTIYEKTKPDVNDMWWSMLFKKSIGKWVFLWQNKHIVEGEISYSQIVESCADNVPGKFIFTFA